MAVTSYSFKIVMWLLNNKLKVILIGSLIGCSIGFYIQLGDYKEDNSTEIIEDATHSNIIDADSSIVHIDNSSCYFETFRYARCPKAQVWIDGKEYASFTRLNKESQTFTLKLKQGYHKFQSLYYVGYFKTLLNVKIKHNNDIQYRDLDLRCQPQR